MVKGVGSSQGSSFNEPNSDDKNLLKKCSKFLTRVINAVKGVFKIEEYSTKEDALDAFIISHSGTLGKAQDREDVLNKVMDILYYLQSNEKVIEKDGSFKIVRYKEGEIEDADIKNALALLDTFQFIPNEGLDAAISEIKGNSWFLNCYKQSQEVRDALASYPDFE